MILHVFGPLVLSLFTSFVSHKRAVLEGKTRAVTRLSLVFVRFFFSSSEKEEVKEEGEMLGECTYKCAFMFDSKNDFGRVCLVAGELF